MSVWFSKSVRHSRSSDTAAFADFGLAPSNSMTGSVKGHFLSKRHSRVDVGADFGLAPSNSMTGSVKGHFLSKRHSRVDVGADIGLAPNDLLGQRFPLKALQPR